MNAVNSKVALQGDLPGGYEGTIWFEAFPNPGVGDVNVIADDFDMDEPVVVRIYDATGKIVLDEIKQRDDARVWTFDASSWSTGMYIIRATQGGKFAPKLLDESTLSPRTEQKRATFWGGPFHSCTCAVNDLTADRNRERLARLLLRALGTKARTHVRPLPAPKHS